MCNPLYGDLTPARLRALHHYEATGTVCRSNGQDVSSALADVERARQALKRLTAEEERTLRLLVEDYLLPEIAAELGRSVRWLQNIVLRPLCEKLYGVAFPRWMQMWWPPKHWNDLPTEYFDDRAYAVKHVTNRCQLQLTRERTAAERLEARRTPIAA